MCCRKEIYEERRLGKAEKGYRGKLVSLTLLLMVISAGFFGCVSIPDLSVEEEGGVSLKSSLEVQGIKTVGELEEGEQTAALKEALEDWRIQAIRLYLEEQGKVLEKGQAQAFAFYLGADRGTIVLLPFDDLLVSFIQFREKSVVMLTMAHLTGTRFEPVLHDKGQGRLLRVLGRYHFHWLKERFGLTPGQTLFLDDTQGKIIFITFANDLPVAGGKVLYTGEDYDPESTSIQLFPNLHGDSLTGESHIHLSGSTDVYADGRVRMGFPPRVEFFGSGVYVTLTNSSVSYITVSGDLSVAGEFDWCYKSYWNSWGTFCSTYVSGSVPFIPPCVTIEGSARGSHYFRDDDSGESGSTSSFSSLRLQACLW